ncbi:MAG TPA: nucleotide-binding protein [Solirubrobacterales bacterium]|jgi:predicted nucleotide-binding protein
MDTQEYWHVAISPSSQKREAGGSAAIALDRARDWIEERILDPRRRGEPIAIDGQTFSWEQVASIRISTSSAPSERLIAQIKREDQDSDFVFIGGSGYREQAVYAASDKTDDLISGPPGSLSSDGDDLPGAKVDPRAVMVVHGRDEAARRACFDFLRAIGLRPLEWGALVSGTGKAAPYVGEVLDHAFSVAAAVLVLFTPDDEGRLRDPFHHDDDPSHETHLTPQPRPNVLFEAGMALGVHPNRTVLVEHGSIRPFSDVYGRHVVRVNGTDGPLRDIARRLKQAGCAVDLSGDDWASPDRFPAVEKIAPTASSPKALTDLAVSSRVADLNEDTRRWLQDRDREFEAESRARTVELSSNGLLYSGARLNAVVILRQQALQQYRDEISGKRRLYREIWEQLPDGVEIPRFELSDADRAILGKWRGRVEVDGVGEAEVDDPTDASREPDLRRFEIEGDGPKVDPA